MDRIEIRNGRRCRIEVMRRDAAGNVVSEFVQPLDDEPEQEIVLRNQPPFASGKDERFIDADADVPILNTPEAKKPPTVQRNAEGVPILETPSVNVKPKTQTGKAQTVTNDADEADDTAAANVPVLDTPKHKGGR